MCPASPRYGLSMALPQTKPRPAQPPAPAPTELSLLNALERQVEQALEHFEAAILKRPEVMECYLMTGDADYLLRIVTADLSGYERFLIDHLTRVPGVSSIKSSFALKQVKYLTALPVSP